MTIEDPPLGALAPTERQEAKESGSGPPAWPRRGWPTRSAALLCAGLFVLFASLGILSPGTFDDDDLGRYFYTRAVFESWDHVLSLFVRPAFALLYALPAQLGYGAVEIVTALLSALTCWFVYRTARILDEEPAEMGIVLTAFQPQFLAVSFSALCEPLAALLLASSLYFLESKRHRASALVVSALPLARVELAPLLALWAVRLWRAKSWSGIAILPWGMLLWNAAGFFHTGDPLFLWHQIFVDEERTYETTALTHYLEGYIAVVGPVVFGLSLVGLVHALRRRQSMIPVLGTIAVIGIYTWLSSASSAGQSAGRLRYLVSIAPLFALLALRGFRASFVSTPSWVPVSVLAAATALCGLFLSRELVGGVSLSGKPDYFNFYLLVLLLGAALWRLLRSKRWIELPERHAWPWIDRPERHAWPWIDRSGRQVWVMLVVAFLFAGTFRHSPVIALTPERRIMQSAAEWYLENDLSDRVTLCNHVWFSALAGVDVLDPERRYLNKANLIDVPAGSIAIWEPHYADRHRGDVTLTDLESLSGYRILRRFAEPGTEFFAVALEKLATSHGHLTESGYSYEELGIEWTGLSDSGWHWENQQENEEIEDSEEGRREGEVWTEASVEGNELGRPELSSAEARERSNSGAKERSTNDRMIMLRGEHPRGAVLQLMRVRFVRFPSTEAYLSHVQAEISSQGIASSIEPFSQGVMLWGRTRDRGLVIVSIVDPDRYEGLHLVGYFPPEELQWMLLEVERLLSGLRIQRWSL